MRTRAADLNGWWVAVDGELGGVRLPVEALADLALRFWNGTFTFGIDEGHVVLHRHARPAALDIMPTHGPNRGRVIPGIVEFTVDGFRICCDLSGQTRPEEFRAPAGTRRFLAIYRRTPIAIGRLPPAGVGV